jgi:hypothetical protein
VVSPLLKSQYSDLLHSVLISLFLIFVLLGPGLFFGVVSGILPAGNCGTRFPYELSRFINAEPLEDGISLGTFQLFSNSRTCRLRREESRAKYAIKATGTIAMAPNKYSGGGLKNQWM